MSWLRQQQNQTLQIDHDQSFFQAYLNCINSFQGLETESIMEGGSSMMVSRVSDERFERTVTRILYPMILNKDRDQIFEEAVKKLDLDNSASIDQLWHEINELLERNQFWKRISIPAHI